MAERRQLEKISINNTKEVILQVVPYEDYGNTCPLYRLPETAAHKKPMVPQKRDNFFAISTRHIPCHRSQECNDKYKLFFTAFIALPIYFLH